MATKFEEMAVVVSQKEIATDIYDLTIQTKEIAAAAKAGTVVSNGVQQDPVPYIVDIDKEHNIINVVYTSDNADDRVYYFYFYLLLGVKLSGLAYKRGGTLAGAKSAFAHGVETATVVVANATGTGFKKSIPYLGGIA